MFDSSMLFLLHVVICGGLSYFCNFRCHISIIANSSFWKVSQLCISVITFHRLSYLISVRNSCLVFLYGRLDATLDHELDEAVPPPASHSGMVLVGPGIFSVVLSFISLYNSLMIN